jgi:hypothetical protein
VTGVGDTMNFKPATIRPSFFRCAGCATVHPLAPDDDIYRSACDDCADERNDDAPCDVGFDDDY